MNCKLSSICPIQDCRHRNGDGDELNPDLWIRKESAECNNYSKIETLEDYFEQRNELEIERRKQMFG